jgi:hypothetical protein
LSSVPASKRVARACTRALFSKTICGGRKSIRTRAKQGKETEKGTKEKGWRLEMGGKFYEMRHTDKERRKEDTVSRGGLLDMGVGEMIGGSDLDR